MSSFAARLLRVNLSTEKITVEDIPGSLRRNYIGGEGFGIRYLYEELKAKIDPLAPDNKLLFATGVLAGTRAYAGSRWVVMSKSPLTGCVARASAGGSFGAWMKFAGFDLVIVEGKAERPVYIYIDEEKAKILPAKDFWGLDTQETQARLKRIHGGRTRVATIGPAGENLIRYACIVNEARTASRCGVGAVMGSKNLKAIAINARMRPSLHAPERFDQLVQRQLEALKTDKRRTRMSEQGSLLDMPIFADLLKVSPVRNFREGNLEGTKNIYVEEYDKFKVKDYGCYGCVTRCGKIRKIADGPYAGITCDGPEYEANWAFGCQVSNTNGQAILAANYLCDALGLDVISTGNAIGFACELFERDIITFKDTRGLELRWGNHEIFLPLIQMIARREGFGEILAEGVRKAGEVIGGDALRYALHVKGMEMPGYDPRAVKGFAISYAVSNIGASHVYGRPRQELYGRPGPDGKMVDRFAEAGVGKGGITFANQKAQVLNDSVMVCNFSPSGMTPETIGEFLAAVTGIEEFQETSHLDEVCDRIICLERAFNVREGFSRKDDTLPIRFLKEPLENAGEATGQVVRNLDALLDEFYDAAGYSREGKPSASKLKKLGLEHTINDMA